MTGNHVITSLFGMWDSFREDMQSWNRNCSSEAADLALNPQLVCSFVQLCERTSICYMVPIKCSQDIVWCPGPQVVPRTTGRSAKTLNIRLPRSSCPTAKTHVPFGNLPTAASLTCGCGADETKPHLMPCTLTSEKTADSIAKLRKATTGHLTP